ncbi:hypothetical protein CAPTEDRAFT_100222 [Capitella teleta]|uniref:Dynein light chain n=1 Tax=Capitella teleta TaxID=283909 RepID=R7TIM2_CAPTE|nr:hypothetical protein CAPTEDRAFT_100222 [Capitella teleta]|eukprot:ELT91386.1 hypothetical protein CAPTEDRAFT_100222 [Capitella teleta]
MVRFQKAMGPSRRTSAISSVAEKPPVRMENTFQMEPRMDQRFKLPNVHETMNEVLARYLSGYKYEPRSAQLLSKTLTNEVTRAVKSREWPRHRIICQVTMTEQKQQDMRATSRCLWNANTDTHISASYSGSNFVVLATVYAVYLD